MHLGTRLFGLAVIIVNVFSGTLSGIRRSV
jgi:hypothetical protein